MIDPNRGTLWKNQIEVETEKYGDEKTIVIGAHMCFEGKIDDAKSILSGAENRLIRLRCLQGRLQYLISAFLVTFIPLIFLLGFYFIPFFKDRPSFFSFALILTCGAMGGFLSVSLNVWKLDIDLDASRQINCAAGSSRILIAMVASIFAYFAIKSQLILSILSDSNYGIYLASFASGFSESFIPNVIRKLSEKDEKNGTSNNTSCKI